MGECTWFVSAFNGTRQPSHSLIEKGPVEDIVNECN